MDVLDAALSVASDYPGGARALGARMGKSNLSDELNPNVRGAKLGLKDAVNMELLSDDYRILHAHCAMTRHYPPLKMPGDQVDGQQPCLKTLSETAKEFSDLIAAIVEVSNDGEISDNDMALVNREHGELLVKLQSMMEQLAAMNSALHARQSA